MMGPPLQVIDSFLLNYNLGDALLLVVVLGAVGLLLRGSRQLLAAHLLSLGLLFVILPAAMLEPKSGSFLAQSVFYKFFGLAMLVVAPVEYAISRK